MYQTLLFRFWGFHLRGAQFGGFPDAKEMFEAYYSGPEGHPELAMRNLERVTNGGWRDESSRTAWYNWSFIGRLFEREMASSDGDSEKAVAALQTLADRVGTKSKAPDWMAVIHILRNTPEEEERRVLKREAAARNKQKKESSKAKAAREGLQMREV